MKAFVALLVAASAAVTLAAEANMAQIEKDCRYYAEQEAVPAEELDAYMKDCIRVLKEESREDAVSAGEMRGEEGEMEGEPKGPKEE